MRHGYVRVDELGTREVWVLAFKSLQKIRGLVTVTLPEKTSCRYTVKKNKL